MGKIIKYNIRDILNEIKWTKNIEKAEIWYIHRGAQNNTRIVTGKEIIRINKSFFESPTTTIPYHRIFKILYDGNVVFDRYLQARK